MKLNLMQEIEGYKLSNGHILKPVSPNRLAKLEAHAKGKGCSDDKAKKMANVKHHFERRRPTAVLTPAQVAPSVHVAPITPQVPASAAAPDSPMDGTNQGTPLANTDKMQSGIEVELPGEKIANSAGVINNKFQLPHDGFIHLAPIGEHPHNSGILQVIDKEAVDAMVSNFNRQKKNPKFTGVLLDKDHKSQNDSTEASGWIVNLAARDDGLWGQVSWTNSGEKDVMGGSYRLVSPVWLKNHCDDLGNQRLRPKILDSCALTNEPNLKNLTPISKIVD